MEVDISKEVEKLQAEITQLQGQLQQVEQGKTNLTTILVKKVGMLEMLQGFEAKPKEKAG